MSAPSFIEINGKRVLWRELLERRREQREAVRPEQQPTLFELKEDHRPAGERNAAERYREPSLFSLFDREG